MDCDCAVGCFVGTATADAGGTVVNADPELGRLFAAGPLVVCCRLPPPATGCSSGCDKDRAFAVSLAS